MRATSFIGSSRERIRPCTPAVEKLPRTNPAKTRGPSLLMRAGNRLAKGAEQVRDS